MILERVVRYIVCAIVDDPTAVRVTAVKQNGDEYLIRVETAPGEMGLVIGRGGRTARAIRQVAQAAADEEGFRSRVEFVDTRRT